MAEQLLDGISIDSTLALFLAALLLGVVNAVVRPVFVLSHPAAHPALAGLFLLVINALMLELVAALVPGMHIAGFGSAVLGSILISLVSWAASAWIGPSGKFEVLVVERRREP